MVGAKQSDEYSLSYHIAPPTWRLVLLLTHNQFLPFSNYSNETTHNMGVLAMNEPSIKQDRPYKYTNLWMLCQLNPCISKLKVIEESHVGWKEEKTNELVIQIFLLHLLYSPCGLK